ncbi:uncharacterized protein LOC130127994 isoform X1 [Lampris incognitus]|uniref:uncharacterized protein LOC130120075 n=1 Tax=Lampris incognitus TaxID=2546036 RepID=UPI0024B54AFC|nr:uncharacterized protein LOC130106729 isoform X1 [Lampris incognitus]XP_056129985.1 uncharacterized protein LOC130107412 isoform X1 [Lampris incognitus]XP_056144668.1 uncharacterized protein LOC130120075 [Lampris incognitus]XP_056148342.1 uncharacterized protein LOC130123233 isoform X1 [Lampris incognitus]XP_056149685.1 uncharacterized protein LOC130124255 isoform X1 [Lampris incognitus]XP_056153680.1 uncharacterized protein LOC130127994 isoform X1 [Lampris incognitus]
MELGNKTLCIVCKESGGRDITAVTAPKLLHQVKLFEESGLITNDADINLSQRLSAVNAETLQDGYKIHKSCYDRYNNSHFNCAKDRKRKRELDLADHQTIGANTRAKAGPSLAFGAELCFYCEEPAIENPRKKDKSEPLLAAAGKEKSAKHVKDFTDNLEMMAKVLNDGKILRLLETDVRSRELFYHRKCHSRYRNRYSSASCRIKQERTSSQNSPDMIQYAEYIAMEEVGNFIDDSSENVFDLHKLENIYLQKVEDLGFDRPKSHSTRFAEKLSNSCLDINVVQKETGAHYRVIKKGSLDNVKQPATTPLSPCH